MLKFLNAEMLTAPFGSMTLTVPWWGGQIGSLGLLVGLGESLIAPSGAWSGTDGGDTTPNIAKHMPFCQACHQIKTTPGHKIYVYPTGKNFKS